MDSFRRRGNLSQGVPTQGGGTLRVAIEGDVSLTQVTGGSNVVDNTLLSLAVELKEKNPETPVVLVTKDTNLRIKADALSISAQDYETGRVDLAEVEPGHPDVEVDEASLERLAQGSPIELAGNGLHPNQYVRVHSGRKRTVLGRVDSHEQSFRAFVSLIRALTNVQPRNMEQHFALDALLDPAIVLVTLTGKAGTGKTLLALAAGLHQTCDLAAYLRLLVARPMLPMGRDVGYLPGGIEEKLHPWMQPVYDNLSLLLAKPGAQHTQTMQKIQRMFERGVLAVEPLTYIRGRTMSRQYLIVDEAQNLTPLETKTIVTRAGEGTKLVFTGDPDQIDNPYIDSLSSGFNTIVERFREESMAAHVHLVKGERSPLAERASNLL
jgi:PhoH-like ATPase